MVKKAAQKKGGKPNAKEKPGQSGSKDKAKPGDGTAKKTKTAQNDAKQKSAPSEVKQKVAPTDPNVTSIEATPIDTQPMAVLSEEKSIPESVVKEKSAPNDDDQVVPSNEHKERSSISKDTPIELKDEPNEAKTKPSEAKVATKKGKEAAVPAPVPSEPTYCDVKHPLNQKWTLWYYLPEKDKDWERCQHKIHSVSYVEDFWSLFDHIKQPSDLTNGVDYSFFKNDIRPMWEDPQNVRGGRITVVNTSKSKTAVINEIWLDVLLFLIGENFDYTDEVCGVVLNVRNYGFKVAVWTAIQDQSKIKSIGKKLKSQLCSPPSQPLSFELHSETLRNSQTYGRASSKSFFNI